MFFEFKLTYNILFYNNLMRTTLSPIKRIPYPLIACRFSCDYGNELICIHSLQVERWIQSRLHKVIHPGNYQIEWATDAMLMEYLANYLRTTRKKVVYAIEDPEVLKAFLWLEQLKIDAVKQDEWSFEYFPLWEHFLDGMDGEVRLFQDHWIKLEQGREQDLLGLFTWKKKQ